MTRTFKILTLFSRLTTSFGHHTERRTEPEHRRDVRRGSPGGWLGPDRATDPGAWTHRLTDDEIVELDAALASAEAAGLDVIDLTPDNFPLPSLASRLDDLRAELVHGRGLHLFKGVPVHRYTPWQRCAVFYGMGAHMGWTCPQNARGHVLGHVKDLGTFLFILHNILFPYGQCD